MSHSSSPVRFISDEVANAMKDILLDYEENEDKKYKDTTSKDNTTMTIENSPGKLINKTETSLLECDTNIMFELNSDDSLADPNYESISDSDDSEGTPATKKKKKCKSNKTTEANSRISLKIFTNPENLVSSIINTAINQNTPPSRKRKRNEVAWKCNVRNTNRQKGKPYIDILGNNHPAKALQHVLCTCTFRCTTIFNENERQILHDAFWRLDDKAKNYFYSQFVQKLPAKRKSKKQLKKREFSYSYYFKLNDDLIRVCKSFFLKTLDISSRRIQWFFTNNFNQITGIATSPTKGKHVKKQIANHKIEEVKQHIQSFPRVESHYCRENTQKLYLDSNLNVQKMFNLYKEICTGTPVKKHMYYKIFNEEFNCAFHLPKKDQCDLCTQCKHKINLSEADKIKFNIHEQNKIYSKTERDKDRKNKEDKTAILTYDLENVFALPKAEISNFYYRRKFAVYNLTGHCNLNKTTYCSIWTEAQSGRSGNDIASALYKILLAVVQQFPNITNIILWSDSCVAQNKNRVNTTMILKFLQENSNIETITHKYSEPGHSQLQEVDAVHSAIERHLRGVTIHSPITLMQQLKKLNYDKVHLRLMQMKDSDFLNFNLASKIFVNMVPFMKVRVMQYHSRDLSTVWYKTTLCESDSFLSIKLTKSSMKKAPIISVKPSTFNWAISEEKKKDIRSMLKYMEKIDIEYYNTILNKPAASQLNVNPRQRATKVISPLNNNSLIKRSTKANKSQNNKSKKVKK